jgi:nucleosome binding factor SPN SPT16 subunit
MKVPDDY